MAVLGSLALGACSSDNDSIDITGNEADQLITLTVANNNTIRTRAGRPLVSAEANQSIENVLVYVVNTNDNSIAATKKFSSWQSESQEYGTNDGKYANFLLENKLEDGTYKIFAVGYHNSSSYGDIESALKSGSTFKENAVLQLTSDNGAEEIFAGATGSVFCSMRLGNGKNDSPTVLLSETTSDRQHLFVGINYCIFTHG